MNSYSRTAPALTVPSHRSARVSAPDGADKMSPFFAWLAPLALLLSAPSASAACTCRCVEGVARTICTTLEEAAANPQLCTSVTPHAERPPAPAGFEPQQFSPPGPGAQHCREARLWNPEPGTDTITTKVCHPAR